MSCSDYNAHVHGSASHGVFLCYLQVEKAEQLDVPVPHLETLVTQIEAMQRMYNLF